MNIGARTATRRIVIASVGILLLLAAAVTVSIWRYQHAISQKDGALAARSESLRAELAGTVFWRERESANEYLLVGTGDILSEVRNEQVVFNRITVGLGRDAAAAAAEASLVARARAAGFPRAAPAV